jgi:hypothetical protein
MSRLLPAKAFKMQRRLASRSCFPPLHTTRNIPWPLCPFYFHSSGVPDYETPLFTFMFIPITHYQEQPLVSICLFYYPKGRPNRWNVLVPPSDLYCPYRDRCHTCREHFIPILPITLSAEMLVHFILCPPILVSFT